MMYDSYQKVAVFQVEATFTDGLSVFHWPSCSLPPLSIFYNDLAAKCPVSPINPESPHKKIFLE